MFNFEALSLLTEKNRTSCPETVTYQTVP